MPARCLLFFLLLPAFACQPAGQSAAEAPPPKIRFDLSQIDADGLYGPDDGKRALDYEFCIPADSVRMAEVQAIDPSLQVYPASRGRVDCDHTQYLCIGNTHQPRWREILLELAALEYVKEIRRTDWE
jgi:hypothetical protein